MQQCSQNDLTKFQKKRLTSQYLFPCHDIDDYQVYEGFMFGFVQSRYIYSKMTNELSIG